MFVQFDSISLHVSIMNPWNGIHRPEKQSNFSCELAEDVIERCNTAYDDMIDIFLSSQYKKIMGDAVRFMKCNKLV